MQPNATWAPCIARPPCRWSIAWEISCSPPDAGREVPETIIDMPDMTSASASVRWNSGSLASDARVGVEVAFDHFVGLD